MPARVPSPEPSEHGSEASADYTERSDHQSSQEPESPQAEQDHFEAPPPYNHAQGSAELLRGPLVGPNQFFQTALLGTEPSGAMLAVDRLRSQLNIAAAPPQDVLHPSTPPHPFGLYNNSERNLNDRNDMQLLHPAPVFLRGQVNSPSV